MFKPHHTVPCHTVSNLIERKNDRKIKYFIFNLEQKILSFIFRWMVGGVLSIFLENRNILRLEKIKIIMQQKLRKYESII